MNTLKNSVTLIGRLGTDPEIRAFESGRKLASFPVATNETYTNDKGEKVDDTQWHNITAWGRNAENAETILKKGSYVALRGKLIYHSFEQDGNTCYVSEVQVLEFLELGKKID
ncbi:MAG: single-stranded DNA-binding protein [Bacteroidota bacterium]